MGRFEKLMTWLSSRQAPCCGISQLQALTLTKAKVSGSGSTPSQFHAFWAAFDLSSSKWVPALCLGIALLAHSPVLETKLVLSFHLLGLKCNLALNLITFGQTLDLGSPHIACWASSCVASFLVLSGQLHLFWSLAIYVSKIQSHCTAADYSYLSPVYVNDKHSIWKKMFLYIWRQEQFTNFVKAKHPAFPSTISHHTY